MTSQDELLYVPLSAIHADNEFNCRESVTTLEVSALAQDIRDMGQISPVTLRRMDPPVDGKHYMLIAGYRRFKAFNLLSESDPAKYSQIAATVKVCNDLEALKINLSENIQRTELNIKEEAHAIQKLIEAGMDRDQVGKELKKSPFWVHQRICLLDLPEDIQDDVVKFEFTQALITELWKMPTNEQRYQAVNSVKDRMLKGVKVTKIQERERPSNKKLTPKKPEIFAAMEKIAAIYGAYNDVTRALAWAAGTVTDNDLYRDLTEYARVRKSRADVIEAIELGLTLDEIKKLVELI